VLAALGGTVWSHHVLVDWVEYATDDTMICALDDARSLFLFDLDFEDIEMCAGVGDMI
jgi:hypothetical protein